ncbi:MAG: Protein YiiM [Chroococcidiopsis cubana SAG 39.79]|uniref:Molybdenum cofactor biosysynthesis protein n=2 Tax=Chroococcidiopsis TaxID=54298 RepID=A0AB37U9U1_9CYAN|nr:MOSC domain-containing protein [Chroococcidiopsis cubana]MDZ4876829.1 Protein YiiM [Chroococcidiopsis cubana SAG 39.79]RUT01998.1 molybdenum cofactor biosysynthesis protein [Chroococcidiopsis cubana SAG 39.79]
MVAQILSIQVGLPKLLGIANALDPMDRPWSTGFFKEPIQGRIWLGSTNLAGDGQADLKRHGGVEKAVLVYAAEHYPSWRSRLNLPNLFYGAFGENFTVTAQTEASVCIGDIYDIGEAQVQVSQPRQPCWKLSRRWRIRDLALQVQCTGQTGWYFRVLKEGAVEAGMELVLRDRPFPQWTIARANQIMHHDLNNREAAAELASCPLLASNWQRTLLNRAAKNINPDSIPRLWGEN